MTSKEKANELFEFYSQCGDCPKEWAKLNAIKVVDEILSVIWINLNDDVDYWAEVKQEIENL